MGTLTDEMTRLAGEVRAGRGEREAFVRGLKCDVSQMQTNFHDAHAEMASKKGAERKKFVSGVKRTVGSLQREFGSQQREVRADIRGAREAWATSASARSTTPVDTHVKAKRKTAAPK